MEGWVLKRFLADRSGNYAMMMAVVALPLLLSVGVGVDYARAVAADRHLQELADAASLALASSDEKDKKRLRELAEKFVQSNLSDSRIEEVRIARLETNDDWVDLRLEGSITTSFMSLASIRTLDVGASSLAERAITGSVEVALVLDNTWSMSEEDGKGVSRIEALKEAAGTLVEYLMEAEKAAVRIGLVPYADYVNVGTQYRNASWLSVPDDYSVKPPPRTCETRTTQSICVTRAATYKCTRTIDGVEEQVTCGGGCTKWETQTVPAYEVCSGGGGTTHYRWHGCVGSRTVSDTRLNDGSPNVKYPGYVETSQRCLNPIVPLTDDEKALTKAINGMIINRGSYKPYTYIPSGLIWGLNLLSPTEPFAQAGIYDPENRKPRKVMVLMTDGDNTLRFRNTDGRHVALSGNAATAQKEIDQTNRDTAAICDNMKANDIEIFSVAFMVENEVAKKLLESCATDSEHYYDATDSEKLMAAFSGIAESLRQVRLAR